MGLASVVFGFVLGVPLGILAGYQGGRSRPTIMRAPDMLMAFPTLLLALIIVTALGGTLLQRDHGHRHRADAELRAPGPQPDPDHPRAGLHHGRARDRRGQLRVMARHVFPNALYALVVVATLYIATAIRTEASLSFLGLGIPPPTPSWGNILSEGRQYIKCCPWITTFSGLAIMLAVLAFNLVGDALRDLLDPRLKGE